MRVGLALSFGRSGRLRASSTVQEPKEELAWLCGLCAAGPCRFAVRSTVRRMGTSSLVQLMNRCDIRQAAKTEH